MQCKYRPSLSIKANDHDIQIHIWWQSSLWTSLLAHWFSFHLISVMKPPLIFFQFCLYLKLVGTSDFLSLGFHISFSLSYTQSSLWRESRMGHFLGLFDFRQIARTRKLSPRAHSPSYRVGDSLTSSLVCIYLLLLLHSNFLHFSCRHFELLSTVFHLTLLLCQTHTFIVNRCDESFSHCTVYLLSALAKGSVQIIRSYADCFFFLNFFFFSPAFLVLNLSN